jgi:hypothetical protein
MLPLIHRTYAMQVESTAAHDNHAFASTAVRHEDSSAVHYHLRGLSFASGPRRHSSLPAATPEAVLQDKNEGTVRLKIECHNLTALNGHMLTAYRLLCRLDKFLPFA